MKEINQFYYNGSNANEVIDFLKAHGLSPRYDGDTCKIWLMSGDSISPGDMVVISGMTLVIYAATKNDV